jgi:hypothetical protein
MAPAGELTHTETDADPVRLDPSPHAPMIRSRRFRSAVSDHTDASLGAGMRPTAAARIP